MDECTGIGNAVPRSGCVVKGGIDNIPTAKKEDIAKATNYVKETWVALAEGKKVPHSSTKPYGCSIKYSS